jgi:CPA2 family monovalent cation:H+ antiporter-2
MSNGPIAALLVLLTIGLPLVFLANRVRVGALSAYLLTGALAGFLAHQYGSHWAVLSSISRANMEPMAEIGASLLLFSLGLELDLPGMRRHLRQVLVSAGAQIGLTVAVGTLTALASGLHFRYAFALGCCLTMSSTLLVLRALDERRLRHRQEGQMVVGLLLAQDLCLAPLMALLAVLLPVHSGHQSTWLPLVAIVVCLGLTIFARRVLATPLLDKVRAMALPELEVAFAVIVALGAAWVTEQCHLGAAVGAFCAGLALGGDEHRHAVETSTRPLQALMAIVFFASMGVLLEFDYVVSHALAVFAALLIALAVKAGLAALALWLSGLKGRSAVGGGIMTAQLGEFSFVLAATAFGHSANRELQDLYQLVVTVTCLSLIITPLLVSWAERFLPRSPIEDLPRIGTTIVVAGLGPVGNTVVETLRDQGATLLLVDRNRTLLKRWLNTPGVRTHLGRIEDMDDWLPVLGHRPALVVLTFPIADTSALVTSRLRHLDPSLVIIARSPYNSQVELLHQAGAQFVICDERETTRALLPMLRKALHLVRQDAQDAIPTTRIERRSLTAAPSDPQRG